MTVPASTRDKAIGALMLVVALAYLVHFVPRGWIPHDEGMLAQSAERVLRGGIPHIDYEETYTGGLSWIYAAVFKLGGIDLLYIRWFLFAAASLATWLTYATLRRFLEPLTAALGAWVALAWSFPNYFAGLPSWWLLLCALACIWAVIRYEETERWAYLFAAGLSAGVAVAIKQTGIYLVVALLLTLVYDAGSAERSPTMQRLERLLQWTVGSVAVVLAAAILASRMFAAEGLYLFCPAACCALTPLFPSRRQPAAHRASLVPQAAIVGIAVVLPLVLLIVPYVAHGGISEFLYGAFVVPRKRLEFASLQMPPVVMIVTGVPMLGLVVPVPQSMSGSRSRVIASLMWVAAVLLPIFALWNIGAYQLVWQSTRALAALLPMAICWRLARGHVRDGKQRRMLFSAAATLAWMSLNQFPYAGGIYFSYVAPLAVIAGVEVGTISSSLRQHTILPWTLMVILFAVLGPHRAYIGTLGSFHVPRHIDVPLDLPRAHLKLEAADADMYRRVVFTVEHHLESGTLIAGPDCPEVYFLAGASNRSRRLFDFFSGGPQSGEVDWSQGKVIVVNHRPQFSPAPGGALLAQLREEFPHGEDIGKFEVRWR